MRHIRRLLEVAWEERGEIAWAVSIGVLLMSILVLMAVVLDGQGEDGAHWWRCQAVPVAISAEADAQGGLHYCANGLPHPVVVTAYRVEDGVRREVARVTVRGTGVEGRDALVPPGDLWVVEDQDGHVLGMIVREGRE